MKIRRILQPGQPGTKKLMDMYGDNLICVRYRYDHENKRVLKTIEIIVDSKPWEAAPTEISPNRIVNIHIPIDEIESRRRVKAAGGRWDPKRQVWRLVYDKERELGLTDRIVETDEL